MTTPLTRRLAVFALANFALGSVVLIVGLSVPWTETVLMPPVRFFQGRQAADSWTPMKAALEYSVASPAPPVALYQKMFFGAGARRKGFQYPPTALIPVYLIRLVAGAAWYRALEALTWLFVPVTAWLVLLIYERSLERGGSPWAREPSGGGRLMRAALVVFLTLTFYPAMRAYANGQVQTWINALFAGALWCWLREDKAAAGVMAAAMCLIKPQYALLAVWGVLRRQWGFVRAWAITAGAGLAASIALFGLAPHLEYFRVLRFISRRGESFFPNQSVNGLLHRLFFNGENVTWDGVAWMEHFPPFHRWVYLGTLLSSAALIAVALWRGGRGKERATAADLCIMALTSTMASPIAWEHHYGILLPTFAFLLPAMLARQPLGRMSVPFLAASYCLSSNSFWVTKRLADTWLNALQSYLFFSGLMVLASLYALQWRAASRPVRRADRLDPPRPEPAAATPRRVRTLRLRWAARR